MGQPEKAPTRTQRIFVALFATGMLLCVFVFVMPICTAFAAWWGAYQYLIERPREERIKKGKSENAGDVVWSLFALLISVAVAACGLIGGYVAAKYLGIYPWCKIWHGD